MKVRDFQSGVSFKAYYQEPRLTHQGGLLFDEPYTGSLERGSVPKLDASYGAWSFPVRTKETYYYRADDAMECDITITYHDMDNYDRLEYGFDFDEPLCELIDKIDVIMTRHGRTITIHQNDELLKTTSLLNRFRYSSKIERLSIFNSIKKCYHILDGEFASLTSQQVPDVFHMEHNMMMIKGIVSSESTPLLAETLLNIYCEEINETNDANSMEMTPLTLMSLIYEIVIQNRGELLRKIPLMLRTHLITEFNKIGRHDIVAALNHYHKGDYKDPGKDLVLL